MKHVSRRSARGPSGADLGILRDLMGRKPVVPTAGKGQRESADAPGRHGPCRTEGSRSSPAGRASNNGKIRVPARNASRTASSAIGDGR
jgi:hypothetical protein